MTNLSIKYKIVKSHYLQQDINYFFHRLVDYYEAKSETMYQHTKHAPSKYGEFYWKKFEFESHNYDIYSLNHIFNILVKCKEDETIKYNIILPITVLNTEDEDWGTDWRNIIKKYTYYQDITNGYKPRVQLDDWVEVNDIVED